MGVGEACPGMRTLLPGMPHPRVDASSNLHFEEGMLKTFELLKYDCGHIILLTLLCFISNLHNVSKH